MKLLECLLFFYSSQNLEDIAVQAVCTEFLITYCDILFCEELPRFADLNFDLGIEVGGDGDEANNEVDIDGAIERAEKKKEQNKEEVLATIRKGHQAKIRRKTN